MEAVTYKIGYKSTLSCAGPDGVYTGGTGDDSCTEDPVLGAYGAGLTADMNSHFEIVDVCGPDGNGDGLDQDADTTPDDGCPGGPAAVGIPEAAYSNFANLATMGVPASWWSAIDKAIPDGAAVGVMTSIATLGLLGGACNTTLPVVIPMFDCTTANFEGVNDGCPGGAGFGDAVPERYHHCNDNQDNDGDTLVNEGCPAVGAAETGTQCDNDTDDDGDGDPIIEWNPDISGENLTYGLKSHMPKACYKYPNHVNIITEGMQPRARYYGFVKVLPTMPPTQLQFLIFSPEQLTQLGTLPHADMQDEFGYINFVILDNPRSPAAAGSALEEFCTPLSTDTNLWGKTGGQGHLTQDVPPVPPLMQDTFWVVEDPCGDGIDDNGDTRVDELCGIVRVRNPEANTGFSGTGSHLAGAYSESNRDADGDTIPNNEDECPYTYDIGVDAETDDPCDPPGPPGDFIDAACDPDPNDCNYDQDNDGYSNQQDNCPLVQNGCNTQECADNCEPDPCPWDPDWDNQADEDEDGIGDSCDVGWDDDGDGAPVTDVNEGCPTVGVAEVICDGAEAGAQCANAIDDDGDGVVNDGCPAVGVPERGHQCFNNIDDGEDWLTGADGVVNDGCPAAALDDDGDTYVNDGCTGATAETGAQCEDGCSHPDGPYLNDMFIGSICIGALDTDGDGWCDATEDLDGYLGSGNPISDKTNVNSVPEWRVLDPLIRAMDNPPGQAPGTCSNREWYSVDRLGGAEIDDDLDGLANLFDPNACPGMKLDLQTPDLQPPVTDPLELPCASVPGSTWHELWPTYSNTYTATGHIDAPIAGVCVLSQGDQILLDGHWYHVDEVTITIDVLQKEEPFEEKYLEWYASAESMQDAIENPQATQWHEIYPTWSEEYDLLAWYDDPSSPDGVLSASDQIVLANKDHEQSDDIAEYHVERVSIDIIVVQKPDGDIDQDHVPDDGDDGIPGNADDDNCPNDWNPSQLDTDGDGVGDECDTNDDDDALTDVKEWRAGSDPKNVCDPFSFDLSGDGKINILDVGKFLSPLKLKPFRPCYPPVDYSVCP